MDMKKILQALDSTASKPVEGSNDMKKFLSVVTESVTPHKVTLPVQMAMQHYAEPKVEQPKTIKEVKKSAMSGLLQQYYTEAHAEVEEKVIAKKELISEQARQIAQRILAKESRVDELSPQTLASYKKKAGADATAADKAGDFKRGDKRMSGIIKATKKEFAHDATKESFSHAEYDQEGHSVKNSLLTTLRAVKGLGNMLGDDDNLPEWCQEKISIAENYLVTVWDYLQSEEGMQESRMGNPDTMSSGDYDRHQQNQMDHDRREFKRQEMEHELGHETNNYAVSINGKSWKVFGSRQEANRVSLAMERKYPDKKIGVHATGASVSEGVK